MRILLVFRPNLHTNQAFAALKWLSRRVDKTDMQRSWGKVILLCAVVGGVMAVLWTQRHQTGPQTSTGSISTTASNTNHELTADQLFDRCYRSVVRVFAINERGQTFAQGSGFIVSGNRVVTNAHVVENAARLRVVDADGNELPQARLAKIDVENDLAIISANAGALPALELLHDSTMLRVGQHIYAVGAPKGLPSTLSDGIVSAVREGASDNSAWLQITAPLSPGSSGGPVLHSDGKVVGIATAQLVGGQNLNFAIPAKTIQLLLDPSPVESTWRQEAHQIDWQQPSEWLALAGREALQDDDVQALAEIAQEILSKFVDEPLIRRRRV